MLSLLSADCLLDYQQSECPRCDWTYSTWVGPASLHNHQATEIAYSDLQLGLGLLRLPDRNYLRWQLLKQSFSTITTYQKYVESQQAELDLESQINKAFGRIWKNYNKIMQIINLIHWDATLNTYRR